MTPHGRPTLLPKGAPPTRLMHPDECVGYADVATPQPGTRTLRRPGGRTPSVTSPPRSTTVVDVATRGPLPAD